ncbi:MAG TPA: NAD+ synthase, partial [Firmicutes bacterium]|nr:NAD+ synthase [Bacillota bacterium]
MQNLRLALAQINTTVGDIRGNTHLMLDWIDRAREAHADVVAFPELATIGYPPEDLLFRPDLLRENLKARDEVVAASNGMVVVFGFVDAPDDIYNAAAIACDGSLAGVYHKEFLPNYGVFDENRYFQAGIGRRVYEIDGVILGVNICEDIWYPGGPTDDQALIGGAHVIVNLSASPYHRGKIGTRDRIIATRASDNDAVVALVNLVGGQDELVFDGGSLICDETGAILARGKQFEEDLIVADVSLDAIFRYRLRDSRRRKEKYSAMLRGREIERISLDIVPSPSRKAVEPHLTPRCDLLTETYRALTLGLRDYVEKNRFKSVVVGLSGGIDSALTVAIAVDALGADRVVGVTMPSRYSSEETRDDARIIAENLGIKFLTIPIEDAYTTYIRTLEDVFTGYPPDVTEENIQARIRGNLIMALSNKFGWLVLTTGNKSEMSVGYATLYGDMAGGFAVLKDVYKTTVFELSLWRNAQGDGEVIPNTTIERPPTAELRPNQKDEDSLPPYAVLDPILEAFVERDETVDEIV